MPTAKLSAAESKARWMRDPCAFVAEVLRNPETGAAFELYAGQKTFMRAAFARNADGRLKYTELVFSAPKKSGKTALAAMLAIYVAVVLSGNYGEIILAANDYEQAQSRVFEACRRIIEASPLLRNSAKLGQSKIEFTATRTTIMAIASEFAGAAGAAPNLTIADELWGFASERSHRLWDELVPVPTKQISARLVVTYAGFSGESELLESLYKRGMAEPEIAPDLHAGHGILLYWTHRACAKWQDERWIEEMRQSLRPNQFLRMIRNEWVTSESSFVDLDWWDACTNDDLLPVLANPNLSVWVGVDASVKRDSSAIVACAFVDGKVQLIWHRIFQPSPFDPLDFEQTIEKTLLELRRRFYVREVRYDPYQMVAVAQRLVLQGLPMIEFPQSVPNLTEASSNLYECIKGHNLCVYPDAEIRLAVSRAVALETSRGWRIAKEKQSHKIDVVVSLAQAALGAVHGQGYELTEADRQFIAGTNAQIHAEAERSRSTLLPSVAAPAVSRLDGRGEDWARWEDRISGRGRGRFGRGAW